MHSSESNIIRVYRGNDNCPTDTYANILRKIIAISAQNTSHVCRHIPWDMGCLDKLVHYSSHGQYLLSIEYRYGPWLQPDSEMYERQPRCSRAFQVWMDGCMSCSTSRYWFQGRCDYPFHTLNYITVQFPSSFLTIEFSFQLFKEFPELFVVMSTHLVLSLITDSHWLLQYNA